MTKWEVNKAYRLVADTAPRDLFNIASDFEAFVTVEGSTTATPMTDVSFVEVLEERPSDAPQDATSAADAPAGSTTITVDSGTTLTTSMVGMVYRVYNGANAIYLRVVDVDDTEKTVTFARPIPFAMIDSTGGTAAGINFGGNTGVYVAELTFDTTGIRIVTARATAHKVNTGAAVIEVVTPPTTNTTTVAEDVPVVRLVG